VPPLIFSQNLELRAWRTWTGNCPRAGHTGAAMIIISSRCVGSGGITGAGVAAGGDRRIAEKAGYRASILPAAVFVNIRRGPWLVED
jgi:hypothetical protein